MREKEAEKVDVGYMREEQRGTNFGLSILPPTPLLPSSSSLVLCMMEDRRERGEVLLDKDMCVYCRGVLRG